MHKPSAKLKDRRCKLHIKYVINCSIYPMDCCTNYMKTCIETKERFHIRATPFVPALDTLGLVGLLGLLVHEDKTRDNSRAQEQWRDGHLLNE